MKHLKYFEEQIDYSKDKYWKLNSDSPYYEISLKKIGMNEEEQKDFISHRNFWKDKQNFIYIVIHYDTTIAQLVGHEYCWAEKESQVQGEYMGEVKVTPEEILTNKYNL